MTERIAPYAASTRPRVTVIVTDVDNTLYDWMAMWWPAFGGMLARLAADSGVPRETLEREFHALHQRHGTTEDACSIPYSPFSIPRFHHSNAPE